MGPDVRANIPSANQCRGLGWGNRGTYSDPTTTALDPTPLPMGGLSWGETEVDQPVKDDA